MENGCEVGNNFSPQQLEAIEMFATGSSCVEVAEQIGVAVQTISTWRKNFQFMDAIYARAKQILKDSIPEIYKATINKAKSGSHQHIKIILDHLDNLDKLQKSKNVNTFTFTWDTDADNNTI